MSTACDLGLACSSLLGDLGHCAEGAAAAAAAGYAARQPGQPLFLLCGAWLGWEVGSWQEWLWQEWLLASDAPCVRLRQGVDIPWHITDLPQWVSPWDRHELQDPLVHVKDNAGRFLCPSILSCARQRRATAAGAAQTHTRAPRSCRRS